MSRITHDPIDPAAVLAEVASPSVGGTVLFLGTVRDHAEGRAVTAIDYDAHATLAGRVLEEVLDETAGRWPQARVAAVHRVGHLEVGEISVAVAAASAHRVDAFAAARFAIDRLKERVPIWKKELSPDGDEWLHGEKRIPASKP